MHIHVVPNRGSPPTVLLRESYREGAKVRKRTLANLSSLSLAQVEAMRAVLRGEQLQPVAQCFEITASRSHGHVEAILVAMQRLDFASLIASKPGRERDLVLAMVAARIIAPQTKLATTRWWHTTTLAADFGVANASEDDLYAAMDWLLARQDRIQQKLAARHLHAGGLVLYDLTSSYFEGITCPLAKLGHNRDGKRGLLQVNYGLLTDARGCPVAVSVHEGNTADSKTFMPEVQRLRQSFGIERMAMVGDRGMIGQKAIADKAFSFQRQTDSIAAEAALDGLYLIRPSVPAAQMDAPDCVRNYKALANVERAFRSLKTVDLKVRPIHHHLADRVRAHIFLCMLAFYVDWHLREAWRELMFADTDQQAKATRDPVAPAKRSAAALAKIASKLLDDDTPAHSFATLMAELATIVRNTCRTPSTGPNAPTFDILTTSNPKQQRALDLLKQIQLQAANATRFQAKRLKKHSKLVLRLQELQVNPFPAGTFTQQDAPNFLARQRIAW